MSGAANSNEQLKGGWPSAEQRHQRDSLCHSRGGATAIVAEAPTPCQLQTVQSLTKDHLTSPAKTVALERDRAVRECDRLMAEQLASGVVMELLRQERDAALQRGCCPRPS